MDTWCVCGFDGLPFLTLARLEAVPCQAPNQTISYPGTVAGTCVMHCGTQVGPRCGRESLLKRRSCKSGPHVMRRCIPTLPQPSPAQAPAQAWTPIMHYHIPTACRCCSVPGSVSSPVLVRLPALVLSSCALVPLSPTLRTTCSVPSATRHPCSSIAYPDQGTSPDPDVPSPTRP